MNTNELLQRAANEIARLERRACEVEAQQQEIKRLKGAQGQ